MFLNRVLYFFFIPHFFLPAFDTSNAFCQFAGAAQSLGAGAILVNPWNITEVANSIDQALNMSPEEREKRHKHNFAHVTTHTAQEWAETFVRYICSSVIIVKSIKSLCVLHP